MKYLYSLIFIVLCACSRISPHTQAGLKAMHSHFKEMNESNGWIASGFGGSFYDNIVLLSVRLVASENTFSIEQTREEMIKGISSFLNQINSDLKLKPHLNHYPFTHKDIEYGISIYNEEGEKLGYVSLIKGHITFYKSDPVERLIEIHTEPYLEALEKIQNSQEL